MLKLFPPGTRGYKDWSVRGSLDGHKIDKSTGCSLRKDAETFVGNLQDEYKKTKGLSESLTFEVAAARYLEFRGATSQMQAHMERINTQIGDKLLTEITFHTLIAAANKLHPNNTVQTKNRAVLTPAAAVMHYAAENNWCAWLRVKKFKEPAAKTRYVDPHVETKLLGATEGKKHLFVLWMFRQGDRVSDILNIKYEDCDLETKTVSRYISKSDRYAVLPLDEEICELLAKEGYHAPRDFIFPWRYKVAMYRWLKPLCKTLKVEFTPHRARHTLGKRLNDGGAGLKTIMQILGQSDPKSAIRYQTTDTEELRRAKEKAGKK